MTRIYIKLIAMTTALLLSVSVMLMSSYAWLVLSANPAVSGIQVAIGGGNTILTAPNIQEEVDGVTYCYPGYFSDKMNFGRQDAYADLQNLGNLTPVSTSNGIDWFLPTYYDGNDEEVQQGKVPSGALRDISEFVVDSELSYANLTAEEAEKIETGNYIYLDFWVVSPGGDYTLRVSTGEGSETGGSFVIDLMEPVNNGNGYKLKASEGSAAAAVRVGFLANDMLLLDDSMKLYTESRYFDNRFTALKGVYRQPNTGVSYSEQDRFTIYEPNADYHPHPDYTSLDGCYVETKSLELVDRKIQERERSRADLDLTVQRRSTWLSASGSTGETMLEQQFQSSLYSIAWNTMDAEEVMNSFYGGYLQGQISTFVNKGSFLGSTGNLIAYINSSTDGIVDAQKVALQNQGATDDVYIIKLERNVPQRIRMFIWLEGQDIDCVDDISSTQFAVNIELAGGSES